MREWQLVYVLRRSEDRTTKRDLKQRYKNSMKEEDCVGVGRNKWKMHQWK